MKNKNYLASSADTLSPLDKTYKKGYNERDILRKNKSIFNNDVLASSALDYLYSNNNRNKTKNFLENNGLPSFEDLEYNKKYYSAQEERKRILDLFKQKTNGILNPKLPDVTDRAFLSGLLGNEEEEHNYRKKLASSSRALGELQDAFRGSQFEGVLKPRTESPNSAPAITNAVNRNLNAKNEIAHAIADPNKSLPVVQYALEEKVGKFLKSSKDTVVDFFNNASAWTNEKGILDDITNAFFKASDLWQDYPNNNVTPAIAHEVLATINYKANQQIDLSGYEANGGYINDQSDKNSQASKIRYGTGTLYENGCEVIAVNNALVSLGNKKDIRNIAKHFETNGQTLFGIFGTSPFAVGDYFKEQGYQVETFTGDKKIYNLDIPDADTYIVSFWNSDKVTDMIHTVSVDKLPNGKYKIYNENGRKSLEADSLTGYLKEESRIPLVLHCIKKGR